MTYEQSVMLSQIAYKTGIAKNKLLLMYKLIVMGKSNKELVALGFPSTTNMYSRIFAIYMYGQNRSNNNIVYHKEPYYQNEQEMEMPSYSYNDLSDEEKKIWLDTTHTATKN